MRTARIHTTRNGKHTVRSVLVIGVAVCALALAGCADTKFVCDQNGCTAQGGLNFKWPAWWTNQFTPKDAAPAAPAIAPLAPAGAVVPKAAVVAPAAVAPKVVCNGTVCKTVEK